MHTHRLPNRSIPVLLSGDSVDTVRAEAAALHSFVVGHPEVSAQQAADAVFGTRVARRQRALAMVADREELISALQAVKDGVAHPLVVQSDAPASARRTAFVFPGQGAQRAGMGRVFYEQSPAYRAEADRCAQAFEAQLGMSPLDYLVREDAPEDDRARVAQPALFTQMAGLAAMWRAAGVEPAFTIGHSQGEIAAAYVSGMVTLHDAVSAVGVRSAFADDFAGGDYAMAVAAVSRDVCEEVLARSSGWAQLSVVNSPNMIGVSGDRETLQGFVDALAERDVFARMIRVRFPAHTSEIARLDERFAAAIDGALDHRVFAEAAVACVGSTFGGPITPEFQPGEYWFRNLRNTVRFDKAVASAAQLGADVFVELAAHPTLRMAIHENLGERAGDEGAVVGTSSRTAVGLDEFVRNLATLAVRDLRYRWDRLREEVPGPPPAPLADFPNAPMRRLRLWLPYRTAGQQPVAAPAQSPALAAEARREADGSDARLLAESWVRLSQRSMTRPSAIGLIDHTGKCAASAAALLAAAENYGATARVIEPSDDTAGLDTLVVLLPAASDEEAATAVADTASFFGDRAWWPEAGARACCLVTIGGESVTEADRPPSLAHAAASAGFRSVGVERPGVSFRHVDLDCEPLQPGAASALIAALHTAGEPELALRGSEVYAKRLVETSHAEQPVGRPDHVVITGGTGKLGVEFCEHFAALGAKRISLVSRSGAAAGSDRLDRIRAATSARIELVACDVSDKDSVSQLARTLQDAPVDLLVHAAVDYADIELEDITTEKARRVLDAKVLGAAWACEALPRARDFRVVLCSSVAATIGGRGQAVYAAANRMLDALATRLRADGTACASVQWGQWETHMDLGAHGLKKLAGSGIRPLRPAQALALGMSGSAANFIVAALDLDQARFVLEPYGYGPLLSGLVATAAPAQAAETGQAGPAKGGGPESLLAIFADVVGDGSAGSINVDAPMVALGLDSLQALELRRRVKTELGHDLSIADMLAGASVKDLMALFASPEAAR
ncbi:nocobactin polyketide synthase NbtC [Segniliparus rugosus]|uniref:Carrier domain-containing protein n=1 Tax=Segniliparus rugosus (strain ATCC BAA-974 / DSM 45345 / CCUG 50838 / CIP 108380 / JCM 13579 / CDC 945) TaxID=679197 RepID=E5XLS8_SEGRC|nr:nocobactin polyketide synthase NbtC [Segniliparus rugosus]EFV14690.2 hypothetical protein HMPREF9336_00447 [Segniliparus rugosus ATCC BAA-974]